ncbi:MAG: MBL fold metallo-hydrolase [Clostridia bacterium]|nr:MBL fold metallo-hydrolase [Clostridia bacterium]
MQLIKIRGNSYYINAPTNIGVYSFKNKNCLLVDTGINNTQARKIGKVLVDNRLHTKHIINTHGHTDHCGGNHFFKQNYPGCLVYTSEKEKIFLENPKLHSCLLYCSNPLKEFNKHHSSHQLEVDFILESGMTKIDDQKFLVQPLPGHSPGQIGVLTPDKVLFLGDALFSQDIMDKYSIPYLFDIEHSIDTMHKIKDIDADYFLLAHSEAPVDKDQIIRLIDKNIDNIQQHLTDILELLSQPMTREDLLQSLIILKDLPTNFLQYHLHFSAVSAFLKALYDNEKIDYSIEDGKLYYFRSPAG